MPRFVIGIDLGTSNCAAAFVELSAAPPIIRDFQIPQLVRAGEVAAQPLLPSVVYLPAEGELPAGAAELPWGRPAHLTGELARWLGARVPGRVVTSAKSWLIHPAVDRQAKLLPWGAAADVPRLSPPEVQAALLRHIADAWNAAHPQAPFAQQEIVITIPASFDEGARALTLQAARDAGYPVGQLALLEEPQAAFYDFTSRHQSTLAKALAGIGLVLVVDVGGGTTDFSLVQVAMRPEGPALERIAVGDHLLLGGDNMDAALAKVLEQKLLPHGAFSTTQWTQALLQARAAKETLLGVNSPDRHPVVLTQGGSRLIGSTLSTDLTKAEVEAVVVDGFFPHVGADAAPRAAVRGGVVELGLPYAADAAITRHVVAFLRTHSAAAHAALSQAHRHETAAAGLPRPDAILLNGGVFNSNTLSQALVQRLSALWPQQPGLPLLPHSSLDLAVARGAAASGLARRAMGRRITAGAARAYYVAIAGQQGTPAVCVVPRGLPEGSNVQLTERTFSLLVGKPVQFQLYATTSDRLDLPGAVVDVSDEATFKPLPALHTVLSATDLKAGQLAQVTLEAGLSELGTLTMALLVPGTQRKWRLEFELKGAARTDGLTVTEVLPARFAEATVEIERVFGSKPLPVEPRDVKNLFRTLERLVGPRDEWEVAALRELWTSLFAGAPKRRRSPDHERLFFQLLGFTLRPGRGYPLDAWRCEQSAALIKEALTHHGEAPVWAEFWVCWRRLAGGLSEGAQQQLWAMMEPSLAQRVPPSAPPTKEKRKGIVPQGLEEMVRCACALELLEADAKRRLGGWIVERLTTPDGATGPWAWALGRLGARVPLQAAAHRVLSPEAVAPWVELLLSLPKSHEGALFGLVQLTRRSADRARDVPEETRRVVLSHLRHHQAPAPWVQLVEQVTSLSGADEARVLGEALPAGLRLSS